MKNTILILLASASIASFSALAEETSQPEGFGEAVKDAWIMGKIETLYTLNQHLNPFAIQTEVENGYVRLSGEVDSSIDRDLAGELAKGIDGVVNVNNDLTVAPEGARAARVSAEDDDEKRSFRQWVDDTTTSAGVKSKLLANANTKGLKIDVNTQDDVVTLRGEVNSSEAKQLAGQIALNTGDVEVVKNELTVAKAAP